MPSSSEAVQLAYGETPDGRIVHVGEVARGSACGCICPACKVPLVARKGPHVASHFAHHAGRSCAAAYETMLHRLAKQIIADRRIVLLPAVEVRDGTTRRTLRPATLFRPDAVALEPWQGSIRPDIVVTKGGKELLVEIRVTHACTPEKLAVLAGRRMAAIEIDLSGLPRHLGGAALEDQVLRIAPRGWLWNPHAAAVIPIQAQQAAAQLTSAQVKMDAGIEAAPAGATMTQEAATARRAFWAEARPHVEAVEAAGLARLVGHELAEDACFAAPRAVWQSWIVSSLLEGSNAVWPATVGSLHDWLACRRLVGRTSLHAQTSCPPPGRIKAQARQAGARPATAVLADYMALLRRAGIIRDDLIGMMEPSPDHLASARSKLAATGAAQERMQDLLENAVRVLDAALPRDAAAPRGSRRRPTPAWANGFDVDAWMHIPMRNGTATPASVARQGGPAYRQLAARLRQLTTLAEASVPVPDGSSLGLPITAARAGPAQTTSRKQPGHEKADAAQEA